MQHVERTECDEPRMEKNEREKTRSERGNEREKGRDTDIDREKLKGRRD